MRYLFAIPLLMLTGCGFAPTDIAIGGAAAYALYGDEIEEVKAEDLQDPKTYRDAVPPQAKQGARRVADNMRDNVRHNARKAKEWWFYDPQKEAGNRAVPSSYCYSVLQDIVCYRQPMPGWESRLVGYQGTGATPPVPAVTKPLPKLTTDDSRQPAKRIANAKPTFSEIPQDMKKEKPEELDGQLTQPAATDAAQEILPDPTMAPQL